VVRQEVSTSRHCGTIWLYFHVGWRPRGWEFQCRRV